ncbi:MAG: helix-turn-helix domain-containing protein [Ilumatobacteraceae bacterium]
MERGYAAMTIAALADAAGVSTQTIYNSVGNKAAVIKAVYDVTLAGDDDPRPMNERPEFQALADATDAEGLLRAYGALGRQLAERVGPLLRVLLTNDDDDVRAFAATIDGERLRGNGVTVAHLARSFGLPPGMTEQRATDIVWTLT